MTRLALVVAVAAAGVTTAVTGFHHHKRPVSASSATPTPVLDMPRVSRDVTRLPLRSQTSPGGGVPRRSSPRPVTRPASAAAAQLADVTMYCATGNRNAAGRWPRLGDVAVMDRSIPFGNRVHIAGNVYTVADWIGSGSQFDIFGGDDAGCEQRALMFGRRHLSVVVTR